MYLSTVLKCLLIGWINALPAGPAAIVCLRRTVIGGQRAGMVSGLGMALADALYVIVARAGLGRLPEFVAMQRFRLLPVAGIVVIAVGLSTLKKRQRLVPGDITGRDCRGLLASTFLLSLTNPLMLVSLPALFAALGLNRSADGVTGIGVAVASVFGGSMLWWSIATRCIGRSMEAVANRVVRLVSVLLGLLLIVLGIVLLLSVLV